MPAAFMGAAPPLAVLAFAGLALCACATAPPSDKTPAPIAATPTQQYSLKTNAHEDQVRLAPHLQGLSREQVAALTALASRWQDDGGGVLTIETPLKAPDARAAYATSAQARQVLQGLGVQPEQVREAGYEPAADAPAAVIVGFIAREPVIDHCGVAWEDLSKTFQNKPMSNFGCALTSNMAAQIANPADIAGPRASDPPDATRQTVVIDNYRQGKLTAGAKDQQSNGAVSSTGASGSGGGS